jgi:hypothetical protein
MCELAHTRIFSKVRALVVVHIQRPPTRTGMSSALTASLSSSAGGAAPMDSNGGPPGDIMLVCSDGQQIRAHSHILMLSSTVLRNAKGSQTLKVRGKGSRRWTTRSLAEYFPSLHLRLDPVQKRAARADVLCMISPPGQKGLLREAESCLPTNRM